MILAHIMVVQLHPRQQILSGRLMAVIPGFEPGDSGSSPLPKTTRMLLIHRPV